LTTFTGIGSGYRCGSALHWTFGRYNFLKLVPVQEGSGKVAMRLPKLLHIS
jgi:hypothetical protein